MLSTLQARGVGLFLDGNAVVAEPGSQLNDDDRRAIRANKPELIRLLFTSGLDVDVGELAGVKLVNTVIGAL